MSGTGTGIPVSTSGGTVLASDIFTDVGRVLLDTAAVRWTSAEKLDYLNAGQREIVLIKPDANVVNDTYKLVLGTKQTLPDGSNTYTNVAGTPLAEAIYLLKLIRNMGVNGTTPGAAIPPVDMALMDAINPDWHSATGSATVQNFMYDERDRTHFYVYPQNLGTGYVNLMYSAVPVDVVAGAGPVYTVAISLSDIYRQALTDYIIFRCYSKDAALSPYNAARAVEYWNLFVSGLGRMDLIKKTVGPNVTNPNPSPSLVEKQ